MEILAPTESRDFSIAVERLTTQPAPAPFSELLVDFVAAVSRSIGSDRLMRSLPESVALAHWMRKAHILELKREFDADYQGRVVLPRGIALHFAPSNVDSIFIYSWFLSLLVGNANIVRVSGEHQAQLESLLRILNSVLQKQEFTLIKERNLVISYPHDAGITGWLSQLCQVRVLWGGDDTISKLRNVPLAPLAVELAFADRFSMAALKANAVLRCSQDHLRELSRRFCNDAFVFDQLACSSPRLVLWVGQLDDIQRAKSVFWDAVSAEIQGRHAGFPDVVGIDRASVMFAYAAAGQIESRSSAFTQFPGRINVADSAEEFRELHCGGGLFLELCVDSLPDLRTRLKPKDQTIVHFGFSLEEIMEFASHLPPRAVDRIVPFGQALLFSHTWDGVNLLHAFTRIVDVRL